ncbi:M13 family metallopeptidase [Siphonobacter sp. SORGH_AS_0500]|uniref:M13 family metallopeptidase n=1 Tax=Siphonobacter sp. SORGH_AS_0500 TaxID=1864824 RepID=UPI0028619FAC|nr:M13 family metallopeptidase [Siphonobacter sp. SORGH_AS_0500]MDR6194286.1 putative endopeptidase [Siphonobacter sp. SORGH_AS_0500]
MKKRNVLVLGLAALSAAAFVAKPVDDPKRKGLDISGMDQSVSPREDFFLYANGTWLKNTEIPASETGWGSFNILRDENNKHIHEILEAAAKSKAAKGSIEQRVGDFYASGMDTVAIEKRGYEPIKATLVAIDKIKNYKDLLAYSATHPLEGGGTFLGIGVGADAKNPDAYIVSMRQTGTGLPEKDYYTKDDAATQKVRAAYKKYIATLFTLTGTEASAAQKTADDILALETKIAASHLGRIEMRNPIAQYNKFATKDFAAKIPNLDLPMVLTKLRMKTDTIIVGQPKYYEYLNTMLPAENIETLKAKMKFSVISSAASNLSSPFVNASFEYVGKTLNGQKVQQDRWKRLSSQTDGMLGDLLGQLYVAKYFKPESKKRMDELVANLQKVFETRINALEWMTAETKQEALKKLHSFTPKIGYPTKWKNYEGVTVKRDDYFGNIKALSKWRYDEMINRLGKPVDKTEWGMTPPTVNAYYSPVRNEIAFPAGILQWPFFDPTADDAFNYGAIGAVIGHEMTHGFDDQGRQYNYMGMLKNWWKKEDADQFKQRAQLVIDQFDGYTVLDNLHVKGQLTLGENLADLGGLSVSYAAFKTYTKQGKSNEKIDGFTPDQRFFLAFAQIWRTKTRDEALRLRVNTDPHSPGEFRTNGPLSNFEPFYEAFGVKPGDKMYRPEDIRAKIW